MHSIKLSQFGLHGCYILVKYLQLSFKVLSPPLLCNCFGVLRNLVKLILELVSLQIQLQ